MRSGPDPLREFASYQTLTNGVRMVEIAQFQRRAPRGNFSMERVFDDIRGALPSWVRCRVVVSPFESRGALRRAVNVAQALCCGGRINHITGDVHYLAIGLHGRTIVTIHDCVSLHRVRGWKRRLLKRWWYDVPMARATAVTAISESCKRELLAAVSCPAEKIVVIPNCVSPEFVAAPKAFEHECPLVLQVGTTPNKNIERLAMALAGLCCRLHVVGRPDERQTRALDQSGVPYTCSFELTREEMAATYRKADVVALVSTYEGFGLPIVEANATGRPVVTGNVYSMPEVAGDAACLVDPHSVDAIRSGFERVFSDDVYRRSLVDAGFRNVERFRPSTVAAKYARLYAQVASMEPAGSLG